MAYDQGQYQAPQRPYHGRAAQPPSKAYPPQQQIPPPQSYRTQGPYDQYPQDQYGFNDYDGQPQDYNNQYQRPQSGGGRGGGGGRGQYPPQNQGFPPPQQEYYGNGGPRGSGPDMRGGRGNGHHGAPPRGESMRGGYDNRGPPRGYGGGGPGPGPGAGPGPWMGRGGGRPPPLDRAGGSDPSSNRRGPPLAPIVNSPQEIAWDNPFPGFPGPKKKTARSEEERILQKMAGVDINAQPNDPRGTNQDSQWRGGPSPERHSGENPRGTPSARGYPLQQGPQGGQRGPGPEFDRPPQRNDYGRGGYDQGYGESHSRSPTRDGFARSNTFPTDNEPPVREFPQTRHPQAEDGGPSAPYNGPVGRMPPRPATSSGVQSAPQRQYPPQNMDRNYEDHPVSHQQKGSISDFYDQYLDDFKTPSGANSVEEREHVQRAGGHAHGVSQSLPDSRAQVQPQSAVYEIEPAGQNGYQKQNYDEYQRPNGHSPGDGYGYDPEYRQDRRQSHDKPIEPRRGPSDPGQYNSPVGGYGYDQEKRQDFRQGSDKQNEPRRGPSDPGQYNNGAGGQNGYQQQNGDQYQRPNGQSPGDGYDYDRKILQDHGQGHDNQNGPQREISDPGQYNSNPGAPRNNSLPGSMGPQKSLPAHPAPVRPGLVPNPSNQANNKPAPVRNYNNSNATPTAGASAQAASRAAAPAAPPVTIQEVESLKVTVKNNPNDQASQLLLAKKLILAGDHLAPLLPNPKDRTKTRERNILEAHKILKKLVSLNNTDAMFFLADCYGRGSLGPETDNKEAFTLYQSAAKAGHAAAAYRTAVCCELGNEEGGGTRKDPLKAIQWYQRAATLGDTPAMYKMGMIGLKGLLGQPKNPREAISWLKRAAEQADTDNPHALHELGLLYESDQPPDGSSSIIKDEAYSLKLFMQAGELGYKFSQFRLGCAYEYGLFGLQIDPRLSIMWYSRAAVQEEHQSELALSGWYLTGSEVDGKCILAQSDTEAYLWARKAAMAGLAKAEYAMGYFTEVGIGAPADFEGAKRWYWRAAAQNFPKARERLEDLKKGGSKPQMKTRERITRGKGQP